MPDDMVDAHIRGVNDALAAGWRVLERGGAALDAVEEAVVIMEDDETFDAGRGSFLNRDGKVQLDALIMDGATLRAGGVGCVERLRNPVRAARKILSESPHVYFVGEGAERFAAEHGIALCKNEDLIIPREVERLREYQASASRAEWQRSVRTHPRYDFARHRRRRRSRPRRQHRGRDFDRRHSEQGSRTAGRLVADRLRLLCEQRERRRLHHRMGRTDHEAGAGEVDGRPHLRRKSARVVRAGSDELL